MRGAAAKGRYSSSSVSRSVRRPANQCGQGTEVVHGFAFGEEFRVHATPKSTPARLPAAASRCGITCKSVVPGQQCSSPPQHDKRPCFATLKPICRDAAITAARSIVWPSNGVPTAMRVSSESETAAGRSVVALSVRPRASAAIHRNRLQDRRLARLSAATR